MFDAPPDTVPVWLGLAVVSVVLLGVAASLPDADPDASAVADTVDAVAASPNDAVADQRVTAERVRVGPYRVTLVAGVGAGDTSHATFAYAPVTPVRPGSPLSRVLAGTSPTEVFPSPTAFARAAGAARNRGPVTLATDRVRARHVTWGETDVTLVG